MSPIPLAGRATLSLLAACAAAPAFAQGAPRLYQTLRSTFEVAGGGFGYALAAPGDLDGDGIPEIVVGAPGEFNGVVRVYSGATGLRINEMGGSGACGEFGCNFGETLAIVPDTNGDGLPEIAVGATREEAFGAKEPGAAYLFDGATGALRWLVDDPDPDDNGSFGRGLSAAGDADGDGVGDVAIAGGGRSGRRLLIVSGATGAVVHVIAEGQPAAGLALVGDVRGDGAPELAIGSQTDNTVTESYVYLYDVAAGVYRDTLATPANTYFFSLAAAGDLDGDGVPDLVGGGQTSLGPDVRGAVYAFSGATGAVLYRVTSPNPEATGIAWFGWPGLAAGSDVDGDGVGDVAIGAPFEDVLASADGRAYVVSGATGALLHTFESPAPGQFQGHFGQAVAFTRTADGRVALAVGAPNEASATPPQAGPGRVYVYAFGDSLVASAPSPAVRGLSVAVSPNPSAGAAQVAVALAEASPVRVAVVDALGRAVAVLHDDALAAGVQRLALPVSLAPGVYAVVAEGAAGRASARWVVAR